MLSYRHGFHAGNFADVHKHVALVMLLETLRRKEAGFCFIDTHAGAARYDLHAPFAQKHREFDGGLGRVWQRRDAPPAVNRYLHAIAAFNNGAGFPRHYPGSPCLGRYFLRAQDRMILVELHNTEAPLLKQYFGRERQVAVHHRDGFEALPALVPPAARRGLVLIDPSYELRDEFSRAVAALIAAWKKWPTGVYVLWYPLHARYALRPFYERLEQSGMRKLLLSEIRVCGDDRARRLAGSGLVVVNPPWQFERNYRRVVHWLAGALDQGAHRAPRCYWLVPE
jgi:23S rRNA (adenine2030-N6)-methyltransferase